MPETRISDYAAFLRDLGASKADYFLGGGQAVNFWAEFYSGRDTAADLARFRPFTSKDCDIWVSYAAFKYIRTKTGIGKLVEGTSPADGQLGILSLDTSPVVSVDLMTSVYGVPQERPSPANGTGSCDRRYPRDRPDLSLPEQMLLPSRARPDRSPG